MLSVFVVKERDRRRRQQEVVPAEVVEVADKALDQAAEVEVFNDLRALLHDPVTPATSSAIQLDAKRSSANFARK